MQIPEGLAGLEEKFKVNGTHKEAGYDGSFQWSSTLTWKEIFAYIAPYMLKHPNEDYVKSLLCTALADRKNVRGYSKIIKDQDFQTITLQLKALGLVNTVYTKTIRGDMALFWSLTKYGEQFMMQLRTVPSRT